MTIYEPQVDGYGLYGGVGRDSPYGKSPSQFKFNYQYGPGGSRAQAIIKGATIVGNYIIKNRKFFSGVTAVGGGFVASEILKGNGKTSYPQSKASYQSQSVQRNKRKYNSRTASCCCCTNTRQSKHRSVRRRYR